MKNIILCILLLQISFCSYGQEISLTCKQINYQVALSEYFLYKVTVENQTNSVYYTWYGNVDMTHDDYKKAIDEHFYRRKKGDFSFLSAAFELVGQQHYDSDKEFDKDFFLKKLLPNEKFIYYIFSKETTTVSVRSNVVVISEIDMKKHLELTIFNSWLHKDMECVIFDGCKIN